MTVITRARFLQCLSAVLMLLLAPLAEIQAAAPSAKPNLIFILADDLGIGNVSCYGADNFKTPNLDALAKSGIRFEHFYATPVCGPTRALLLTGRYGFRTGMTGNYTESLVKPENETMVPKLLKPAGYVTAMCGKWSQLQLQPSDWGFDEYLRSRSMGDYWNTQKNHRNYTLNGKVTPLRDGEYLPDLMHNFVVDFIDRHKDQPFHVYYSMQHIHTEILRTPDSAPDNKDLYADNVLYMDKLVGKLVAELDRLKLREKTLIVFAGDNGSQFAPKITPVQGKHLSGWKGSMLECGALVPCIASWPGTMPAGKVCHDLRDFSDVLPTFAELAGAKLPANVTLDGRSFAPQLRGETGQPREWVFVQLEKLWHVRDRGWKLNNSGELFDMSAAPFRETPVPADTTDASAMAARKRLQAVLDQLNPAAGKTVPPELLDRRKRQTREGK